MLVCLAVIVRLVAAQFVPADLPIDNPTYQKAADDFLRNGIISNNYIMPLYPLLLAFFGGGIVAEVTIGVVAGGISVVLVWALSRHIFEDKYAGLMSALVFSLYPMALFYGVRGLTESVF